MTKNEIEQLKKLQINIEEAEKAFAIAREKELRIVPKWDQWYHLPIDKIAGLREDIQQLLVTAFADYLDQLQEKRDSLVLCHEITGSTMYKPTNLE